MLWSQNFCYAIFCLETNSFGMHKGSGVFILKEWTEKFRVSDLKNKIGLKHVSVKHVWNAFNMSLVEKISG